MALSKKKPRGDLRLGLKPLSFEFHPNRTNFEAQNLVGCRICMSPWQNLVWLVEISFARSLI